MIDIRNEAQLYTTPSFLFANGSIVLLRGSNMFLRAE
jgi:hypothetical protein